ncbi:MAG: PAS domain S-box protein, partial [Bacteroidetes bacterium]|nr:PAS domain S-box protein [Bacteroidota bacterium]
SENGYAPLLARNGVEALTLVLDEPVQMIVADAMMPKMDGFQLCKEVRTLPSCSTIPFIIYTGNYVDAADQEFARSIGVDRYVVKYAGLGALVQAINELAQQHYGRKMEEPAPVQEQIDDQEFLEKHRAIVIKKLEEKMAELEMYADTLIRKNREIQASEDRYRTLFDHASSAIFVLDRETGKVLDVNRAGIDLLGFAREELLAMSHLPVAGGDFTATMLDTSRYASGETTITRRDGTSVQVDIGIGPVARPQDTRVLLYVRDISEQKKMREQLVQAEKMTLMGRLAAGIAHEIRNPLSAVALNLQYLVFKTQQQPELCDPLRDALEGTKRIEAVIENTLNLARVTPPVLNEQQINDLVPQVLGFIKLSVQQKEVRFATSYADALPPIRIDAKQIQQVILNVVQNAIDASPDKGTVELTTLLSHPEDAGKPFVELAVRDYGPGLSAEQRKHLFEQFYTTKPGGTGLGLSISKQIVEKHKGSMRIDPADGGGTIVRLLLPIHS